jgi:hypothetical protein
MKAATDAAAFRSTVLRIRPSSKAAREEAQQRQHQDDDQDDPENAQRVASFRLRVGATDFAENGYGPAFLRSR